MGHNMTWDCVHVCVSLYCNTSSLCLFWCPCPHIQVCVCLSVHSCIIVCLCVCVLVYVCVYVHEISLLIVTVMGPIFPSYRVIKISSPNNKQNTAHCTQKTGHCTHCTHCTQMENFVKYELLRKVFRLDY